jgi:hypothetical protein
LVFTPNLIVYTAIYQRDENDDVDSYHQRREKKKIISIKGSSRGTFHSPTFEVVFLVEELSTIDGIESINLHKRMA